MKNIILMFLRLVGLEAMYIPIICKWVLLLQKEWVACKKWFYLKKSEMNS